MNGLGVNNGKSHLSGTVLKSWTKDALNEWVLRHFLKTCNEEAEIVCCGKLFQRWGPAVERQFRRTTSCDNNTERRRLQTLHIRWMTKPISKVRWRSPVLTLIHKNSDLEVNPLPCLQPVKLLEDRSDVAEPQWSMSCAAEFITGWSRCSRCWGMPTNVALWCDNWEMTRVQVSALNDG